MRTMIRVRIMKGVTPDTLLEDGYEKIDSKAGTFYRKYIGDIEIQVKLNFPSNLRIQNWDDNRVPQILMKFLLGLEEGTDADGMIKVTDSGKYKILNVDNTLELIKELNKYTDICRRLSRWYQEYIDGVLRL